MIYNRHYINWYNPVFKYLDQDCGWEHRAGTILITQQQFSILTSQLHQILLIPFYFPPNKLSIYSLNKVP